MQQFNALALAIGAMSNRIFFPAAPPLQLKILIKLAVYWSSCPKNLACSGKVVIRMNSAFICKRKGERQYIRYFNNSDLNFHALRKNIFWAEEKNKQTFDCNRRITIGAIVCNRRITIGAISFISLWNLGSWITAKIELYFHELGVVWM